MTVREVVLAEAVVWEPAHRQLRRARRVECELAVVADDGVTGPSNRIKQRRESSITSNLHHLLNAELTDNMTTTSR